MTCSIAPKTVSRICSSSGPSCPFKGGFQSMIPCCANTIICRAFGFEILMNHHHGDNGSVSSVLNFGAFIFAFCGMVIASSFPSDLFIYGIAAVLALSCLVYLVMWIRLKQAGYPVRNLTEGLE